jgi:hypothetical protein
MRLARVVEAAAHALLPLPTLLIELMGIPFEG